MKKIVLRIASLLLAATIALIPFTSAKAVDYEEYRKSVFKIYNISRYDEDNDGNPDIYSGTCFAIGEKGKKVSYLVTNYHVVDGAQKLMVVMGKGYFVEATVTNIVNATADFAVLELENALEIAPLALDNSQIAKIGDSITTLGYPGAAEILNDTPDGTYEDCSISFGRINKIDTYKDVDFYQIDAVIAHGNSGGPLLNENGYVIGINTLSLIDWGIDMGGSMYIAELINALDLNGIKYEKAQDEVIGEEATQESQEIEPEAEQESSETEDKDKSLIFIIAGGIVILILIGAIVYVAAASKKKVLKAQEDKQKELKAQANLNAQIFAANAAQRMAVLMGVRGAFQGKSINVVSKIYIGRSNDCHVKFPDSTKGISAKHCSLEFNGKEFYLIDQGSSYGTFIGNGQKLTPKTSYILNNGDQFYLASDEQMFQVSIINV